LVNHCRERAQVRGVPRRVVQPDHMASGRGDPDAQAALHYLLQPAGDALGARAGRARVESQAARHHPLFCDGQRDALCGVTHRGCSQRWQAAQTNPGHPPVQDSWTGALWRGLVTKVRRETYFIFLRAEIKEIFKPDLFVVLNITFAVGNTLIWSVARRFCKTW
jgi:hypothetical protein